MQFRSPTRPAARDHVLVVADWGIDPHGVIAACRRRARAGGARFALVVPARLHGLDWIGDPRTSCPCATRQLDALVALARGQALEIEVARVGDPDAISAIEDVLADFAASEILVCDRPRHRHPFALAPRARRVTGLPVVDLAIRRPATPRERTGWGVLRHGGHCPSPG